MIAGVFIKYSAFSISCHYLGEEVETDDPCIECTCHEVEQDVFKILCRSVGCPPAGKSDCLLYPMLCFLLLT